MSEEMSSKLVKADKRLDISCRELMSGAGHDAMKFADICDTAMVFIPCENGLSHNKSEFAQMESVLDGAKVIFEYLQKEYINENID